MDPLVQVGVCVCRHRFAYLSIFVWGGGVWLSVTLSWTQSWTYSDMRVDLSLSLSLSFPLCSRVSGECLGIYVCACVLMHMCVHIPHSSRRRAARGAAEGRRAW